MKHRLKTHCRRGHAYETSAWVSSDGRRHCKLCANIASKERRAGRPLYRHPKPPEIEFREWTPEEYAAFDAALTKRLVKIVECIEKIEGPLLEGKELEDLETKNLERQINREKARQRKQAA
jgi:hypothetical protein